MIEEIIGEINMKEEMGIVFGGGGGKGAYQIGVWKALDKLGICHQITGVSGTSAGALNGALFCNGDLNQALRIWSSLREDMILTPHDLPDTIRNHYGRKHLPNSYFSNEGLKKMIAQHGNLSAIPNSKITFYANASLFKKPLFSSHTPFSWSEKNPFHKIITALLPERLLLPAKAHYFKVNDYTPTTIEKILLASAAIPLVFPDIIIGGNTYADGGLSDNVPILPLYREGFRKFLVVTMDSNYQIPARKFPEAVFLHIGRKNTDAIKSFTETLDFNASSAKARIKQGYDDSMIQKAEITNFALKDFRPT